MFPCMDLSCVTSSFAEKQLGQYYNAVEKPGEEMFRRARIAWGETTLDPSSTVHQL